MAPKPRRRRGPRKATPAYLRNAALHYLGRFASSSANLRRVLMGKVERSARFHGTDPEEGAGAIDALIVRFEASGLLDDMTYATAQVAARRRRGDSGHAIRARLRAKGVAPETVEAALAAGDGERRGPELVAALALARRRRLGPYREPARRAERRERDLAALARAGFAYDVARRVVDAETPQQLEVEISEEE